MVLDAVRQTVNETLLSAILLISEPFAVSGKTYEPALYLDVYEEQEAYYEDRPSYRTGRIDEDSDELRYKFWDAVFKPDEENGSEPRR